MPKKEGMKGMDWYEEYIEEPIRGIVKVLRDNGVNTTSSCGHEMTVQADVMVSGQLQVIHNTLFNYLIDKQPELEYDITVRLEVRKGMLWRCWAEISILGITNG